MELGEKKTFTLSPDEAYGDHMAERIMDFPTEQIPDDMDPQVGQTIGVSTSEGQQMPAIITHVDEEKVTLDLNHPLAGKSLTFDIEVVGINKESASQEAPSCASGSCSSCGGGCG
jgi:peptidylprolyl isomerase